MKIQIPDENVFLQLWRCLPSTFLWTYYRKTPIKEFSIINERERNKSLLTTDPIKVQILNVTKLTVPSLVNQTCKKSGTWEPSSGHFWRKIRTFFRNHSNKDINFRFYCGFVKNWFKWIPLSLHFYLKHHYICSHNPLSI